MVQRSKRKSASVPDSLIVEQWKIDRLKPYGGNPRKNDGVVDRMCDAIREFGFRIPIVARSDGLIVDGHLRYKAAIKLGIKTVPVALADNLSETQIKAFRLLANESASWAEWDIGLLRIELTQLAKLDYPLHLTGFSNVRLATFVGGSAGNGTPDDLPDLAPAISKPGDVWVMGKHRLICGDATDAKVVKKLLGDDDPKLMATDPPYNTETEGGDFYKRGNSKKIGKANIADFEVSHLAQLLDTNIIFTSKELLADYLDLARAKKLTWDVAVLHRSAAVPNHNNHLTTDLDYIVMMGKIAPRNGLDHEDYSKLFSMKSWDRPVPWAKPVELLNRILRLYSDGGDAVFEPYCGSGTMVIAAETTGRACLACEISAPYVDLAVRRWEKFSSQKATLQGSKKTFDQVEKERAKAAA